jgi:hypothetical protein
MQVVAKGLFQGRPEGVVVGAAGVDKADVVAGRLSAVTASERAIWFRLTSQKLHFFQSQPWAKASLLQRPSDHCRFIGVSMSSNDW